MGTQAASKYSNDLIAQLEEALALKLDSICREAGVLLLLVRSYGLAGYLRASLSVLALNS